jgi:hypothetical protein
LYAQAAHQLSTNSVLLLCQQLDEAKGSRADGIVRQGTSRLDSLGFCWVFSQAKRQ